MMQMDSDFRFFKGATERVLHVHLIHVAGNFSERNIMSSIPFSLSRPNG